MRSSTSVAASSKSKKCSVAQECSANTNGTPFSVSHQPLLGLNLGKWYLTLNLLRPAQSTQHCSRRKKGTGRVEKTRFPVIVTWAPCALWKPNYNEYVSFFTKRFNTFRVTQLQLTAAVVVASGRGVAIIQQLEAVGARQDIKDRGIREERKR